MNVAEKAAYIKGLMEGMNLSTESGEGKILAAMADLLEDISLSILDLEDETAALNDYVEELDEDLGAAEEELYSAYDVADESDLWDEDEEDEDGEGECVELECPACKEPIYVDESDLDLIEELECPSCGKVLKLVEIADEEEKEDK